MNKINHVSTSGIWVILIILIIFAGTSSAQDPTKVDSKHYKVILENDQVRVLRITYGPGEKSVMHYHPAAVVVDMTDNNVKMTMKNGKTTEFKGKKGDVSWAPAGYHLPQNIGKKSMEVILVEMKNKIKE